ncbi:anti-phage-associated DUF1156 domain-containing protein [Caldicellulosiruptor bescii]|uniref:DUF1156 domain-containing protein n=2 Tax=Caldicellulosiruptor bescii TaxID=31899 RepID=B9MK36_CALBD|nr:anti-phage-associated DUF1156 domain-containing protein [Caldicellulosiruptor bescii]ACM60694.1 protein of unknown function DUF1156 [Caldicellulosiruptor bescii DSM 6725]SKC43945.1 Adenine-specific DNA methylase, contains a Zn-ribbon domain [Caldicellulosiruptor bescii]SKC55230.1 Adenine-specific DNA methylase, contains a Zn-ribbon domain [Caldicellulosiruptor bescii]SKC57566.1 Adenine-specific DNA methylase, contains a Zn-ribbon domain [Caldicellulosiruptor bescii]SLL38393.1 Adenine-specif
MEKSLIEVQFPVSKLSKEAFKERKAGAGQTLTGLGKWWGRKPLVLVRALLLGVLLPATDDPKKDMKIFLKLMTMDEEGLKLRRKSSISAKDAYEFATEEEKAKYFDVADEGKISYKKDLKKAEREGFQERIFKRMPYEQKLRYCKRPEEIENLPKSAWDEINEHLGTNAYSYQALVEELGKKRFGQLPTVGDCFCGGGSIPFEAARLGFGVFASDLNPIAMLLTWAALNLLSLPEDAIEKLKDFQKRIFEQADKIVTQWQIEHNSKGHRANAYLYCVETICPECGFKVPLLPSLVIGKNSKTIAVLHENPAKKGFDIEIKTKVSQSELEQAAKNGTVKDGYLICPHCKMETSISSIRGDKVDESSKTIWGLRRWEKHEFVPREDDVFQERLYCIRYEDEKGQRYYKAPDDEDFEREKKVIELLKERFEEWQQKGYIPSDMIEEGEETSRLYRERGWAYWHQLFNLRQLLLHGLLMELIDKKAKTKEEKIVGLLGVNRCVTWNSKLCLWDNTREDNGKNTFYNQALNTLFNFNVRGLTVLPWFLDSLKPYLLSNNHKIVYPTDARDVNQACHIWITDPPYADAINYHELSEFFLAWDKKFLKEVFPDWYTDSKRALAVRGDRELFKTAFTEILKNIVSNMPENGYFVLMFTHQDSQVFADLTEILLNSGLLSVNAWSIATETEDNMSEGNFVQSTVCVVLKKIDRTQLEPVFIEELYPFGKEEVERQIKLMYELDKDEAEPNFSPTDLELSGYYAALRVLTSCNLKATNQKIKEFLDSMREYASSYIVPEGLKYLGFDQDTIYEIWRKMESYEKFYIRGIEFETRGEKRIGAYQDAARSLGVADYDELFAIKKSNSARLKTASELGQGLLDTKHAFSTTILRLCLLAINSAIKKDQEINDTAEAVALSHEMLKTKLGTKYWNNKTKIEIIFRYLARLEKIDGMEHWQNDSKIASYLAERVANDRL